MFKQEDYSMLNESEYAPAGSLENINVTLSQDFSPINSQDFNLENIRELVNLDGSLLQLSPLQDEATMDISLANTKYEIVEFAPVSPRGPPERAVFSGELDFQVEINGVYTNKKKYLYSCRLNRIYVDMKTDFPVSFRYTHAPAPAPLYVRACVVFSDSAQAQKRVERCTQHTHDASNADIQPNIVKNVLHSSRSVGTAGVYYCGRVDEPDSWYSVLIQMPDMPTDGSTTHAFQFVCKNSCSSGINRRAIDVIFTLEDASGHVYGRQIVGARACACPRRDMVRDEEDEGVYRSGKKRITNKVERPTKKIKLEVVPETDDAIHQLPALEIIGRRPMILGLEVMLGMMEQTALSKQNDPQALAKYTKAITNLRSKIEELKRPQ